MNRISAGDFHSVIVDCEGEVWVSGESKDGGLGIPRVTTTKKNKLRQLESFGKFQGVVCSGGSSMLLDEDGMIWGAGSNFYGQVSADPRNAIVPFTKFDEQLPPIRFAALSDHFVFIDENGSVWNGGANLYGQLGRGHKTSLMDKRAVLQKISDLPPMKYADCSILSSFLLSEEGEVYASGAKVAQRQLSRTKLVEYVKYTHIPFEIPILKLSTSIHISGFVDVEGGVWLQGHSIPDADSKVENIPPMKDIVVATGDIYLLDEEGNVWVSGTNDYGQLGLGNRKRTKNFTMIPNLPTIIQMTAGKYHALFLDINGSLWGCGNNIQGELGMPDINKSFSPVKNPFAPLIVREAQHRAKSAYSAY